MTAWPNLETFQYLNNYLWWPSIRKSKVSLYLAKEVSPLPTVTEWLHHAQPQNCHWGQKKKWPRMHLQNFNIVLFNCLYPARKLHSVSQTENCNVQEKFVFTLDNNKDLLNGRQSRFCFQLLISLNGITYPREVEMISYHQLLKTDLTTTQKDCLTNLIFQQLPMTTIYQDPVHQCCSSLQPLNILWRFHLLHLSFFLVTLYWNFRASLYFTIETSQWPTVTEWLHHANHKTAIWARRKMSQNKLTV